MNRSLPNLRLAALLRWSGIMLWLAAAAVGCRPEHRCALLDLPPLQANDGTMAEAVRVSLQQGPQPQDQLDEHTDRFDWRVFSVPEPGLIRWSAWFSSAQAQAVLLLWAPPEAPALACKSAGQTAVEIELATDGKGSRGTGKTEAYLAVWLIEGATEYRLESGFDTSNGARRGR